MSSDPERWISTAEAAAHLGKPTSWLYQQARPLQMPYVRLGQQLRWRVSTLDAWLEGQR